MLQARGQELEDGAESLGQVWQRAQDCWQRVIQVWMQQIMHNIKDSTSNAALSIFLMKLFLMKPAVSSIIL